MARKWRGDQIIPYAGTCPECGRDVSRSFPPDSAFLENATVRLFCAECGHPVLCEKQSGPDKG